MTTFRPAPAHAPSSAARLRVGAVSGSVACLWVLAVGTLTGHPGQIPAGLGASLLRAVAPGWAPPVGAQLLVFVVLVFGACAGLSTLALVAVRDGAHLSGLLLGAVFVFILLELGIAVGCLILRQLGFGAEVWPELFGANVAGAAAAGWMIWRRHPELAREFAHDDADDPDAAPSDNLGASPGPRGA